MKLIPIFLFLASTPGLMERPRPFVFQHENVLGTSLELKVTAITGAAAEAAESAVLAEIDRQAKVLSGYDPGSEFSRWFGTRGQAVPVSADLYEVLGRFDRYRELTGGALEPAAETATRVWKSAAAGQRVPQKSAVGFGGNGYARAALVAGRRLPYRHTS